MGYAKETPCFLTMEINEQAVNIVLTAVMSTYGDPTQCFSRFLKRLACHIVILVPGVSMDEHKDFQLEPKILFEKSVNPKNWSAHYDQIAKSKALQLWYDKNDGRTDIMPHLLFKGDSPYYGAVKREGIVVACSGVQPWFDRMISGMIADMIIALAYDAWMKSRDKEKGLDFVGY